MRSKRSSGFISIELMIALVVIAIATAGGISVLMSYLDGLDEQHAAQQQQQVAKAAEKYLKDNFSTVLASAGATAPAVITVPMLRNTRYLPAGFRDTNIYGQQYQVLARKPAANRNRNADRDHGWTGSFRTLDPPDCAAHGSHRGLHLENQHQYRPGRRLAGGLEQFR